MSIKTSFEFECPVKTHYGDRALEHIPFELRSLDAAKPLCLADTAATLEKRMAPVVSACRGAAITLGLVENIEFETPEEVIPQLAAIYRDKDCDAIVAIGQKTFIDMAKWLNLLVSTGFESLVPFLDGQPIPRSLKPLVIIPAAAADGYELSGYLRTQDTSLRSVRLMPQLLFLDPRTTGQPNDLELIETALIALTNGIETFFKDDANPMTAIYARTAAQLAAAALHQLAGRGNRDGRLALTIAHAAAMGGCALGAGSLSTSHRLGLALAASGKLSCAQAMGIILSYSLEYRAVHDNLEIEPLLALIGGDDRYACTPGSQRRSAGLFLMRNLLNQLFEVTDGHIHRTIQDTELSLDELKGAANQSEVAGSKQNLKDDEAILAHAWEGRPIG